MNISSPSQDEPELNLTSLIDVVLLLLVFFMVSTSFVSESKIGIRLPEAGNASAVQIIDEQMSISVTAQGTYLVNGQALIDSRAKTLAAALNKISGDFSVTAITVSADANASHQSVVTAMDVAGKLGFIEISLSTVNTN
ncbi:MAG: biopolymer transporter ExbD [Gammaproteobacteria bacterium]|nr:biopolymer transporter ExbD [Gammaproteobacteria bacterium]